MAVVLRWRTIKIDTTVTVTVAVPVGTTIGRTYTARTIKIDMTVTISTTIVRTQVEDSRAKKVSPKGGNDGINALDGPAEAKTGSQLSGGQEVENNK